MSNVGSGRSGSTDPLDNLIAHAEARLRHDNRHAANLRALLRLLESQRTPRRTGRAARAAGSARERRSA